MTTNHPTDEQLWELRRQAKDDPRCADQHWFILFARAAIAASQGVTAAPQEGVSDDQAIFEEWLRNKRPSGDVESVQYQWEQSSEYLDFHAAQQATQKTNGNNSLAEKNTPQQAAPVAPRFQQTYCQRCGKDCGPGDDGPIDCGGHAAPPDTGNVGAKSHD